MDSTDVKILKCLCHNARMNSSEIAEKVKLSVSAVIERIKKLESNGTILSYSANIEPSMLNKNVVALIMVTIDHPKYNENFINYVAQEHRIVECLYMAGDFDYLLRVVTESTKTLESVLNSIKSVGGVAKTKTNIVLSTTKNSYESLLKSKKDEKIGQ